ncbi:MAG TPA: PD-(D/E)XK nuclease family protein [Acidimicrobiales bacterium]
MLVTRIVPYGRGASQVLRHEIAAAQHDDPLAPVTVVVARNSIGLATRRLLASGDLGPSGPDGRPGVVNVRFTTLDRLAEQIASEELAASMKLPATAAVLRAVVHSTLSSTSQPLFGGVRDHPATTRALAGAYRDLTGASSASLRRLAATGSRASAVVGLVEEVRANLGDGWFDEGQLVDAAFAVLQRRATEPETGSVVNQTGPVVVYLPLQVSPHEERFIKALANQVPVTALVGMTGDDPADESSRDLVGRLGAAPTWVPVEEPPAATRVVSAPTADVEVRMAVREVMQRRRAGVRFERMAIIYSGVGPYDRLVRETLASAKIPFNGVSSRTLAATFAGRTVLGALEFEERGWRRDEVMAWLAGGPVLHHGRPVEATAWDLLSREAGVTAGLDNWKHHLDALVVERQTRIDELDGREGIEAPPARRRGWQRDQDRARTLLEFVEGLSAQMSFTAGTWAEWSSWLTTFCDVYLGRPSDRDPWPTEEEEALSAIRAAADRLAVLDRLGAKPDRAAFRQAVEVELESLAPQTSRFGTGVFVGPVRLLTGLDFDVVFVLGMVDGAFPSLVSDDPLLPDAERSAAGPDIPLRGRCAHDDRRDYLAALAAAPVQVLSYARGDQRRGRQQRPARWLLDALAVLEGGHRRLFSRDMDQLASFEGYEVIPSFTAAIRTGGEPMSMADRDLRELLAWGDAGNRIAGHYLAELEPVLGSGLQVRRARKLDRFTRFDGRIRGGVPSPVDAGALSPTSLETYAECPRRYLMERVLRIEVRDRPEAILTIEPSTKGTLVHSILEEFIAAQLRLPRGERIAPTSPWSPTDHARLDAIAERVFAEYEDQGLTGRPLLWGLARATIVRELHRFLVEDDRYRARGGLVPERVELQFGPGHGEPVALELPGDRTITFKGFADRVDVALDGSASVIDYKTGGAWGFEENDSDPLARGRKLQLPVYGLAARSRLGDVPVQVAYWFVSEKGNFRQISYVLDGGAVERFSEVVTVLVDGVELGLFPARPGEKNKNCKFCDFQSMCPGDREVSWNKVRDAPELASYVALTEGPNGSTGAAS